MSGLIVPKLWVPRRQILLPTFGGSAPAWTPASLDNVWGWWQKNTNIVESSGRVDSWTDTVNSRVLNAIGTLSNRPLKLANGGIDSDGGTGGKALSTGTLTAVTGAKTVCMRVKQIGWTLNSFWFTSNLGSGNRVAVYQSDVSPKVRGFDGTVNASQIDLPIDGNYHTIVAVFNGASSYLRVDSTEVGPLNFGGPQSLEGCCVFSRDGGLGSIDGEIVDLVVTSDALDSTERANYHTWAQTLA